MTKKEILRLRPCFTNCSNGTIIQDWFEIRESPNSYRILNGLFDVDDSPWTYDHKATGKDAKKQALECFTNWWDSYTNSEAPGIIKRLAEREYGLTPISVLTYINDLESRLANDSMPAAVIVPPPTEEEEDLLPFESDKDHKEKTISQMQKLRLLGTPLKKNSLSRYPTITDEYMH